MRTKSKSLLSAFSLVELMVSLGIMSIIFAAICGLFSFTAKSFASVIGYVELNKQNKNAIDIMTRDVRQVKSVLSYSPERMDFLWVDTNGNNNTLTLQYTNGVLYRSYNYGAPQALVTGCEPIPGTNFFRVYQRTPEATTWNNYRPSVNNFTTTSKVVLISWKSSRTNVSSLLTETVQTAKIVIRAQH